MGRTEGGEKTHKGFKIRLIPTVEQEQQLWKHIGCCRYVWNWMLAKQEELYKAGEKHLSAFSMMKLLTPLKNDGEHDWLYEVSNASLQTTCQDLETAYQSFFKKNSGFPKFKSRKKSKPAYPLRNDGLYFKDNMAVIAKIGKVKFQTNYQIPDCERGHMQNPRISYVNEKWILSFTMKCENQAPILTNKPMGIDLGIKETATVAFGDEKLVYHNINKSRRVRQLEHKLKHIQRNVSRKYQQNGSYAKTSNIIKEERRVKRVQYHLANIRLNYTHQTTHDLISKLPNRVVMEDLNVTGMMKNRHMSKAIAHQEFSEFIRQMRYKCEWNGIEFVQADRFYPSSKICSCCGKIKSDLNLSDRVFECECGFKEDRDYNAAVNLMKYVASSERATA